MRTSFKTGACLMLLSLLLLLGTACGSGGGMSGQVDLMNNKLSLSVDHTYRDGDAYVLTALFPDGRTGLYTSMQLGEMPVMKDLESGKTTAIALSDYHIEDVEAALRSAVYFQCRQRIKDKDQLAKIEEKLQSLHGLDILKLCPDWIKLPVTDYSLTAAESDFLFAYNSAIGIGGAIDAKTGTMYNSFRDDYDEFVPVSGYGTKILGRYGIQKAAILDTADLSFESFDVAQSVGYTPKGDGWYCSCQSLGYLADGSIAAILTEEKYTDGEPACEILLGIRRADGGTELYTIAETNTLNAYRIVSGDPDYVIVAPIVVGGAFAPMLVNRKAGRVTALLLESIGIASVPQKEAKEIDRSELAMTFLDVLNDGKTLVVRDWQDGTLLLFRPDIMQSNRLRDDSFTASCTYFYGDRHGRLCTACMSRESGSENGVLLTIVDRSGNPIA